MIRFFLAYRDAVFRIPAHAGINHFRKVIRALLLGFPVYAGIDHRFGTANGPKKYSLFKRGLKYQCLCS